MLAVALTAEIVSDQSHCTSCTLPVEEFTALLLFIGVSYMVQPVCTWWIVSYRPESSCRWALLIVQALGWALITFLDFRVRKCDRCQELGALAYQWQAKYLALGSLQLRLSQSVGITSRCMCTVVPRDFLHLPVA